MQLLVLVAVSIVLYLISPIAFYVFLAVVIARVVLG